jgi:hypothetical protein
LVSAEFARATATPTEKLGAHPLKGVEGLVEVYAPSAAVG